MGGMMLLDHDTNVDNGIPFGNDIEPGFGLGLGYNITNWIAPELQIAYSTSTGQTSGGQGREHALNIRLNAKVSFLTSQAEKDKNVKIYPYVKVGGVAHGLFVNAPVDDDKVGAFGGGVTLGGGVELNYRALFIALDFANDLLFLQEEREDVAGVDTLIIRGGFDYQLSLMGAVGVHF